MEHFVSVFDHRFLPQFLALAKSLSRHSTNHTLWAFCIDREAVAALEALGMSNIKIISWSDMETQRYRSLRTSRSAAEYCWTVTARSVLTVMDLCEEAKRVTYLDSDVWFMQSPVDIFAEMDHENASTLLMEHGFGPAFDKGNTNGKYCVQFMPFTGVEGRKILEDWDEECIEWCFARAEDGKFGDQKYLDSWKLRYGNRVRVLSKPQLVMGPWSMRRFPVSEACAFHFHGLRIVARKKFWLGDYNVPKFVMNSVYSPYLMDLRDSIKELEGVGLNVESQARKPSLLSRLRVRFWRMRMWMNAKRVQTY